MSRLSISRIVVVAAAVGLTVSGFGLAQSDVQLPYVVNSTGQAKCYDNRNEIAPPRAGQAFYGQDAQHQSHPMKFALGKDEKTVNDLNTGLVWERSPDRNGDGKLNRQDKLTYEQAVALPAKLNKEKFGGYDDWRMPTIKELYSLFDGRGTDPSGPTVTDNKGLTAFIDMKYFKFDWGDTASGERIIDSQYASSTKYVGKSPRAGNGDKLFGVNFADGRIKGYDLQMPGGRTAKTFFVICVRGNPQYGKNDFHNNEDGTITDRATGLMWSKTDSGKGMNWQDALAWVQQKNAEKYLGHNDWRLPSVKELESIVDYARSPDTTQSAAIDPVFECTTFTNELGSTEYGFYWSGTTHGGLMGGGSAMYVAFGRAGGWLSSRGLSNASPMQNGPGGGGGPGGPGGGRPGRFPPNPGFPPGPGDGQGAGPGAGPGAGLGAGQGPSANEAGDYHLVDIHGAGAQRSDPKSGDPSRFPHGRGPQGDVIRINNFVRCVRDAD